MRANKGAPGVDRQDFEYIEDVIGVEQFLFEVREQLRNERYRPQPVLQMLDRQTRQTGEKAAWHSGHPRSRVPDGNQAGDRADIRDQFSGVFLRISSRAQRP